MPGNSFLSRKLAVLMLIFFLSAGLLEATAVLSARAQETDKKMGETVGADGYVTKPFEPQVLLGKVKDLIK